MWFVSCVVAVATENATVGESAFAAFVAMFTAAGADTGIVCMFRLPMIDVAEASSTSFSHMRPIV
jgi:hypothetical protein